MASEKGMSRAERDRKRELQKLKTRSLQRTDDYLVEQQRSTQFAPHIRGKGPYLRDEERLCRINFSPDHVHPDGTLKVEGIPSKDLVGRGYSVWRKEFSSRADIDRVVSGYLSNKPDRRVEHVLLFQTGSVRAILFSDSIDSGGQLSDEFEKYQAFIIRDAATKPELRGHAIIVCAGHQTRSKIKELRKSLATVINHPFEMDSVFPPVGI